MALYNLYLLMYPLSRINEQDLRDMIATDPAQAVRPLWNPHSEELAMKVYLSTIPQFSPANFVGSEVELQDSNEIAKETETKTGTQERTTFHDGNTVLLWKQVIHEPSISKSVLLTTTTKPQPFAVDWLDEQDHTLLSTSNMDKNDGGILSTIQAAAGNGIESTSVLLTLYQKLTGWISDLWGLILGDSKNVNQYGENLYQLEESHDKEKMEERAGRTVLHLSPNSPIWKNIQSNSTVHIHVVVVRQQYHVDQPRDAEEGLNALRQAQRSQSLLIGQVSMIKHDVPHHIQKPGRILYHDLVWLFRRYVLQKHQNDIGSPPWDMEAAKPEFYRSYELARQMKLTKSGYSYWKPEVSIKYVIDGETYPISLIHASGMEVTRVSKTNRSHPSGYAHLPALHVDEIGLTSEKYIPVNDTITSLPLRISFDRSDGDPFAASKLQESPGSPGQDLNKKHKIKNKSKKKTTATSGGISPARWRLLSHLSRSFESQKEMGFEQSDIDDLRRMIADTNITLLGITVLASALHLLFEFLTFKNEVSFWSANDDLTGLSVRSLFLDMGGQFIIVLYLIEMDSSLLMIVPSAIGVLIALWKCQKAAGFCLVRKDARTSNKEKSHESEKARMAVFGYEIRATRLEVAKEKSSSSTTTKKEELQAMTIEADRQATVLLGSLLLPLVIGYTVYSLVVEEHSSWYSWLIRSASSAVYAFGFVLMTPQLFLNYKLKSVAHLPWKVLCYKSLNTVSPSAIRSDSILNMPVN